MDGVLTDTVELHYQSFKKLAMEEKVPFNREINEQLRGLSREDSLALVFKDRVLEQPELQRLMVKKNKYFLELAASMTSKDLALGVTDLLELLKRRNIKIALASSSKNTKFIIQKLGIESYFNSISDGYSVRQAKPAPDLFLHAAGSLNITPNACIVVEDAAAGIEAAHAAKMIVIGIGPEKRVGNADFIFPSINTVDLDYVLNEVHKKSAVKES
ncbi:MAG: beta-phosphoglucomutase [Firmicutes bacterium]|nr:beta-phosphoglucomutase [Bacillota bacterium]